MMPVRGRGKPTSKISARVLRKEFSIGLLRKQLLMALKNWYKPNRMGMDYLIRLKVAKKYGFVEGLRLIDARRALNKMLEQYLNELNEISPKHGSILIRRFRDREIILSVAYSLHLGIDQTNRRQRDASWLLAEMVYDDEILEGEREKKKSSIEDYERGIIQPPVRPGPPHRSPL